MDIRTDKDQIYASQNGRSLRWDVYKSAATASKAPVVLIAHGGGWRFGERGMMASACTEYARRGYVAIALEYRLLGEAKWPAPLDDVKLALQSVREQSDRLGVAREQVFLNGFSAGAHLCLLAASALSGAVAGVAAFFPPARIGPEMGSMLELSGAAALAAVSPIEHVAGLPPTIVFCGDDDSLTPAQLSIDLYTAIRKAGGAADLRLYANLGHEFVTLPGMLAQTVADATNFFDRTTISKKSFDEANKALHEMWARILASNPPS